MRNLNEKITRFGVLCEKGYSKGLTKKEDKEFKSLEKEISSAMLGDEKVFDTHIESLKIAVKSLAKFGFDFTK